MLSLPLSATILLCLSFHASAAPQSGMGSVAGQTIVLRKRVVPPPKTIDEWGILAKQHREGLQAKYGDKNPLRKRATGTNLVTNLNSDSSYFGSLEIGTPPKPFNVILDSGSADLWVVDAQCLSGCSSAPTFDPTGSSTFKNGSSPFKISYGSGDAAGFLGQDAVQMAGFTVPNQSFGVCNTVSTNLLTGPVSGLLGLGFQPIASSKAMPFWETLVSSGAWDTPVMGVQLTRYINDTSAPSEVYGGSFSMGFLNSSLFNGDIEFINMPGEGSYWILSLTSINVQNNTISLPAGPPSYAAIDTGTTLVGGPSQYIAEIFAQIPGSNPGTGSYDSYYIYPCNTTVNIEMSFGGQNWTINPVDFQLQKVSTTECVGAFFVLETGSSAPSWIIGDTFLKNVFTAFRYNPLAIGFAPLSDIALADNGSDGEAPTPTTGSVAATVYATTPASTPTKKPKSAASSHRHHPTSNSALVVSMTAFCTASLAAAQYLF